MSATQCCSDMPDVYPGKDEVDRYLGVLFRRYGTMHALLEKPSSRGLYEEMYESMCRVREIIDRFTRRYAGTVYDYMDIMEATARLDDMDACMKGL